MYSIQFPNKSQIYKAQHRTISIQVGKLVTQTTTRSLLQLEENQNMNQLGGMAISNKKKKDTAKYFKSLTFHQKCFVSFDKAVPLNAISKTNLQTRKQQITLHKRETRGRTMPPKRKCAWRKILRNSNLINKTTARWQT